MLAARLAFHERPTEYAVFHPNYVVIVGGRYGSLDETGIG
jgi:hypothetical protein